MFKQADVYITLEFTPNPNTLKYSVCQMVPSLKNYLTHAEAVVGSPLAAKLFEVPGIAGARQRFCH